MTRMETPPADDGLIYYRGMSDVKLSGYWLRNSADGRCAITGGYRSIEVVNAAIHAVLERERVK